MKRVNNLTIEEMFALMALLTKWHKALKDDCEACKQEILANPTDRVLEHNFFQNRLNEEMMDKINSVRSELRFDIEDATDEEYDMEY